VGVPGRAATAGIAGEAAVRVHLLARQQARALRQPDGVQRREQAPPATTQQRAELSSQRVDRADAGGLVPVQVGRHHRQRALAPAVQLEDRDGAPAGSGEA